MTTALSPASMALPRSRIILYWVATVFVGGNSVVAGAMDVLRMQPLLGILLHLGYPAYFATILGGWKVLGGLALLAPGAPRLKEWAYAGLFIDFTAAVASHLAVGDGAAQIAGPAMSTLFLAASWALRPPSRRLAAG
jgi:uncharacterized membrane protein YphA (DoxX/SURF4 family)